MITLHRKGDWMQTFTGKQFWPLDPRPEDICIEDIAHALSMTCRYGGHVKHFYSVAEHSVYVSRLVPAEHALWGLLHDASEAYCADIIRPLKRSLIGYAEIEARVMACVCERFGLADAMPPEVKVVDDRIIADERAALLGPAAAAWTMREPLGVQIMALQSYLAKDLFLTRFRELGGMP